MTTAGVDVDTASDEGTAFRGRKFDQVIEGARRVFLADGFEGASVDAIARAANVSKATLYSYFSDKRKLFIEVARLECQRQAEQASARIDTDAPAQEVLRAAGHQMIGFMLSDFSQRIYRICVAEAERFPELGQQFYASGPQLGVDALSAYFAQASTRGELAIADYEHAAWQFMGLCKAGLFEKRVFGVDDEFSAEEIARVVASAVETFLARYAA